MPDSRHDLDRVLAEIAGRADCRVLPPAGQAKVPAGLSIPPDLKHFHDRCGGVVLFATADFTWQVSGPEQLVPASPRLLTAAMAADIAAEYPTDLTNGCYVIASSGGSSATYIVIDLYAGRSGRCYDAFWDRYGLVGEMPIVALTMTELLRALIASHGDDVVLAGRYGDAYEPRLPKPAEALDPEWPQRWRDDVDDRTGGIADL
jgi:hypothetical protein